MRCCWPLNLEDEMGCVEAALIAVQPLIAAEARAKALDEAANTASKWEHNTLIEGETENEATVRRLVAESISDAIRSLIPKPPEGT